MENETSKGASLHRVRFVDWTPASVASLAVTPSTWDARKALPHHKEREILAVGRGNGDIEVHVWIGGESVRRVEDESNRQGWVLERVLPAHLPSGPAEHLVFAHQHYLSASDIDLYDEDELEEAYRTLLKTLPRLFASTASSTLFEWNWLGPQAGTPTGRLQTDGGNLWSLAINAAHTTLAMGCEDGAVRLVNIEDGAFEITRTLDRVSTRLLSIAFGPPLARAPTKEPRTPAHTIAPTDSFVAVGCADSSVRKWDIKTGRVAYKMLAERPKSQRNDQTLVWSVTVLRDGTIVSGDSTGHVTFWDSRLGVQLVSFRAHKADVLTLAVGPDDRSLYSSGVDQITVQFTLLPAPENEGPKRPRWMQTASRRLHSHDVRTLAISPPYALDPAAKPNTPSVPILVSGGIDMSVTFCPALAPSVSSYSTAASKLPNPIADVESSDFGETVHRKSSFVPQRSAVVHVSSDRLLALRKSQSVAIWQLGEVKSEEQKYELVTELVIKCRTNLISSALSPDGRWLAVSDLYELRVFDLSAGADAPRRCRDLPVIYETHTALQQDRGAAVLTFSPDSTRLVIGTVGARLVVIGLDDSLSLIKVFDQHTTAPSTVRSIAGKANGRANGVNGTASDEEMDVDEPEIRTVSDSAFGIVALAVSEDLQWLASVDRARRLHVYNLDSLQLHCVLPSPALPPTCMTFLPSSPSTLVIGLPNNTLHFFDVERHQLASWARQISAHPFTDLTDLREPMIGLSAEPLPSSPTGRPQALVAWGATWTAAMRLPEDDAAEWPAQLGRKKRRRDDKKETEEAEPTTGKPSVRVVYRYQSLLAFSFVESSEIVAVERPYNTLVADLPKAFFKPGGRFGQ